MMGSPTNGRVMDYTSRAHLGPHMVIKVSGLHMHSDAYTGSTKVHGVTQTSSCQSAKNLHSDRQDMDDIGATMAEGLNTTYGVQSYLALPVMVVDRTTVSTNSRIYSH